MSAPTERALRMLLAAVGLHGGAAACDGASSPEVAADAAVGDAAPPDAATDGGRWPAPPAPLRPAPPGACPGDTTADGICAAVGPAPVRAPCPPGWTSVAAGAPPASYCAPPETGPAPPACPVGSAPALTGPDCAPHGVPCPDAGDGWADDAALRARAPAHGGRIWFVAADAEGGDGSRAAPLGRLDAALASAGAGDVIALGAGHYRQRARIDERVAVLGACVSATRLAADEADAFALEVVGASAALVRDLTVGEGGRGLRIANASAALEALRVDGARHTAFRVEGGAEVSLREVVVVGTDAGPDVGEDGGALVVRGGAKVTVERATLADNAGHGVWLDGRDTVGMLEDVLVHRTLPDGDGRLGIGIAVGDGSQLNLERVRVFESRQAGLSAVGRTRLTGGDVYVGDTLALSVPDVAYGLYAREGATVRLKRLAVIRSRYAGVSAADRGTSVELQSLVVLGMGPDANESGPGVIATERARVTVRGGLLRENHDRSVYAVGEGTRLELWDVTVADTWPGTGGTFGSGYWIADGATFRGARLESLRNREVGMTLVGPVDVELTDLVISGARRADDGGFGFGLSAEGGAAVRLSRVGIDGNEGLGIAAFDPGTHIELDDLALRGPAGGDIGLQALGGALVELRRAAIRGATGAGVLASGQGTAVTLEDGTVAETRATSPAGLYGMGVDVEAGARFTGVRLALRGNRTSGLLASGSGTRVELEDLLVEDTASRPADGNAGRGMTLQHEATGTLRRVALRRNRELGLVATRGATLQASDVRISSTSPAACATGSCASEPGGSGLAVLFGADASVEGIVSEDNALAGILVYDGHLVAQRGLTARNRIGVSFSPTAGRIDDALREFASVDDDVPRDEARRAVPSADTLPLPAAGGRPAE